MKHIHSSPLAIANQISMFNLPSTVPRTEISRTIVLTLRRFSPSVARSTYALPPMLESTYHRLET